MYRKTPFAEREYYHIYSRGVEKRKIFLVRKDYERFVALLYIMNQDEPFKMENFLRRSKKLGDIFKEERGKPLVSILSYCLMPNHFHLILFEHTEGGISKFMGKLLTAYSMYFNTKYERSGPLFTRPFRSEHISGESYYLYIFTYVHLNPLSTIDKDWKENGVKDKGQAEKLLNQYQFSSYLDFKKVIRNENSIIDFSPIPEHIRAMKLDYKTCERVFEREVERGEPSLS